MDYDYTATMDHIRMLIDESFQFFNVVIFLAPFEKTEYYVKHSLGYGLLSPKFHRGKYFSLKTLEIIESGWVKNFQPWFQTLLG